MPYVMTEIAVHRRLSQLVAINAADHGNVLLLPDIIPVFHRTVAYRTCHACIAVLLVTEENKVWKRIDSVPRNEVVVSFDFGQFLDRCAIGFATLMADHTLSDSRELYRTFAFRGL